MPQTIDQLIEAINANGYNVSLHQYDVRLGRHGETRWDATATSMYRENLPKSHVYMDECCFGRDAVHALTRLLEKCKASPAKPRKPKDIFDELEEAPEEEDVFA